MRLVLNSSLSFAILSLEPFITVVTYGGQLLGALLLGLGASLLGALSRSSSNLWLKLLRFVLTVACFALVVATLPGYEVYSYWEVGALALLYSVGTLAVSKSVR